VESFPKITICGCGAGGMAMASDLSLLGCTVRLFEVSEFQENLDPIRENGGIAVSGRTFSGKTGLARLDRITSDPEEALEGSELVFINVPAMAARPFLETLSPHFEEGQVVVMTTGYWAALRCRDLLEKSGAFDKYVFAEGHIMPYLSSKVAPAESYISNWKRDFSVAAWPARNTQAAHEMVKRVYPQVRATKNILENNFQPGNPSVHAQINIPKAAFFFDEARVFRFYGEVSPSAAKLSEAFDVERIAVAVAFDCESPRWTDWFRKTYEYQGNDLYELHGDVRCPHVQRWGPDHRNRRVLIEDLCNFFVPMEQLAEVGGVEVPITKAMLEILKVFAEYDYRSNGVTLKDLGLEGLDRDQIIEFATTGRV